MPQKTLQFEAYAGSLSASDLQRELSSHIPTDIVSVGITLQVLRNLFLYSENIILHEKL